MNNTKWIEQHVSALRLTVEDKVEMDWIDDQGYPQKTVANSLQQCIDIATSGNAKSKLRVVIAAIHNVDFALFLDGVMLSSVDTGAGDSDEPLFQTAQNLATMLGTTYVLVLVPDAIVRNDWSWSDEEIQGFVVNYEV